MSEVIDIVIPTEAQRSGEPALRACDFLNLSAFLDT